VIDTAASRTPFLAGDGQNLFQHPTLVHVQTKSCDNKNQRPRRPRRGGQEKAADDEHHKRAEQLNEKVIILMQDNKNDSSAARAY
jgi:hypothetical protein